MTVREDINVSRLVPNIELQGRAERDGGANEWIPGQTIVTGVRRGVLTNTPVTLIAVPYTAPGTYTWKKPAIVSPASTTTVILVGPGGGGGAGLSSAGTTIGGGGGGGGGGFATATFLTSALPATVTITVPAGGLGGAGAAGAGASGAAGIADTTFGTLLKAFSGRRRRRRRGSG